MSAEPTSNSRLEGASIRRLCTSGSCVLGQIVTQLVLARRLGRRLTSPIGEERG